MQVNWRFKNPDPARGSQRSVGIFTTLCRADMVISRVRPAFCLPFAHHGELPRRGGPLHGRCQFSAWTRSASIWSPPCFSRTDAATESWDGGLGKPAFYSAPPGHHTTPLPPVAKAAQAAKRVAIFIGIACQPGRILAITFFRLYFHRFGNHGFLSNFATFPMGVCQMGKLCYMSRPLRSGFLRIPVFSPLHARFPLPQSRHEYPHPQYRHYRPR